MLVGSYRLFKRYHPRPGKCRQLAGVGHHYRYSPSVHELYGVVSKVMGGRQGEQLVLLAPDGHQLQPQDAIASYGAGTVSVCVRTPTLYHIMHIQDEKPIFVFFKDRDQNQLAATHWDRDNSMSHSSKRTYSTGCVCMCVEDIHFTTQ